MLEYCRLVFACRFFLIPTCICHVQYHVDPDTPVDKQVAEIVKKLIGSGTLSLRKSEMEVITHSHPLLLHVFT